MKTKFEYLEKLFFLRDPKFGDFSARLMPNIDRERVIGVRTPALKSLAKEMIKSGENDEFLLSLPHTYFEENQLHAFIISEIKDLEQAVFEIERFLPFIDNWATCDQLIPNVIAKNPERILPKVDEWIGSGKTYTVRFAIGILMRYFLDDKFDEKYPRQVSEIVTDEYDEYYVNMMSAWYFATALAKQYDTVYPYFANHMLPTWVHNKAIQKARESFRVTDEHKAELKFLVRKQKTGKK